MAELTDIERGRLRGLGQGQVAAVVELILTQRLAHFEALAEEWEETAEEQIVSQPNRLFTPTISIGHAVLRLRAAIGPPTPVRPVRDAGDEEGAT